MDTYYADRRVRGANDTRWYQSIDDRRMEAVVDFGDGERTVPFRWDVCPTCEGQGRHVNPSIDAHGISGDDFRRDPDFAQEYLAGMYDVPCYGCDGRRVVPVIGLDEEDPEYQSYLRSRREDAEYDSICRSERMMGA